jgi:hypothetical protein
MKRALLALTLTALLPGSPAHADGSCRLVEVNFVPAAHMQIAVWIEDVNGGYIDTAYITRSTGALGLGNRPGNALFKSAYRWPYGRREMVLPVWAHKRGKQYPYVTMGGEMGIDAHDDSIGYHEAYSSTENFYCPPSNVPLDAVSCASQFTGSKGTYLPGVFSFYPPRADLSTFGTFDSADARDFALQNDVSAISGATPPGGLLLNPAVRWAVPTTLANGQYIVKVEASLEGDFNPSHMHSAFPDYNQELRSFGKNVFGQPSVVYAVPVTVDGSPQTGITNGAVGYGDWDGAGGTMHPIDDTITDGMSGTGVGRLDRTTDADGTWRVKAFANGCAGCLQPAPPGGLTATAGDTWVNLEFLAPPSTGPLDLARRYEIRYQAKVPLDDSNFDNGIPADMPPAPGMSGQTQMAAVNGLKAETDYYVGIRSINACDQPSVAAFATASTTKQKFVVLHGCFIATAAFGTPMAKELDALRAVRDGALLTNPLGRLAVAGYYALSPPVANAIATDDRLRAAARTLLAPAVALAHAWLLSQHPAR